MNKIKLEEFLINKYGSFNIYHSYKVVHGELNQNGYLSKVRLKMYYLINGSSDGDISYDKHIATYFLQDKRSIIFNS